MAKSQIGDQFTINDPFSGVGIAVITSEVDGMFDFDSYDLGGNIRSDGTLSMKQADIDSNVYNLHPIGENHPNYIEDWDKTVGAGIGRAFEKMTEIDDNGGSTEEAIMALMGGLFKEANNSMFGSGDE